jgi:hypothetical protein
MDCHFVSWCALPLDVQAAWVQAIGTVLALGAALGVPAYQRWRDKQDRNDDADRKAHALAITIVPDLDNAAATIRKILKDVQMNSVGAHRIKHAVMEAGLDEIMPALNFNISSLHVLGVPGKKLLRVCSRVRRIAGVQRKLGLQLKKERSDSVFDATTLTALLTFLREQQRDMEDALEALVETYDMRE